MGGTYPLDPSSPTVICEGCRQKTAAVQFVDDTTAEPPLRLLLCDDCSQAETARVVGRMIQRSGTQFPEGFPDNLSDAQLRELLRRFRDPANWE